MEPERRPANTYLISLWVDRSDGLLPVWRGALVTAAQQRLYFSTLTELNRWLCELAGWQDPPETMEPRENKT